MIIGILDENGKKTELNTDGASSIRDILLSSGIFLDAPCSGNGTCGKCKVKAYGALSKHTDSELKLLSREELSSGVRLACDTYPIGDCSIEVAPRSGYTVQFSNVELRQLARKNRKFTNGIGMAVDIGTTTVVSYYYALETGELLGLESGLNEQRQYGADVISRIEHCNEAESNISKMKAAIVNQLNEMINSFCNRIAVSPSEIRDIVVAGNTVMLHMLCGISASGIAVAPFIPASLFGNSIQAQTIGINAADDCEVYLADSVASYVGGDITAGLLAVNADLWEKPCLYLDIGTNGEMAIGDKNGFLCCATAAGPAFEGARIRHGVGGIAGAISGVTIASNGDLIIKTISDKPPVGICGSGLIDAVACMVKLNIVDETGRMDEDECPDEYIGRYKDGVFLLDAVSGIGLSQEDIREIQLAKSAIAAGIQTLLVKKGLSLSDIDKIVVAGGFGSYMSLESGCDIGLLPREKLSDTIAVGNAAGMGACLSVMDGTALERMKQIAGLCKYFELSGDPVFGDAYIDNMMFEI